MLIMNNIDMKIFTEIEMTILIPVYKINLRLKLLEPYLFILKDIYIFTYLEVCGTEERNKNPPEDELLQVTIGKQPLLRK